jgi:glutamate synthase domain-containing protein 3
VRETDSLHAAEILADWQMQRPHFWQVCPKEMLQKLAYPLSDTVLQKREA